MWSWDVASQESGRAMGEAAKGWESVLLAARQCPLPGQPGALQGQGVEHGRRLMRSPGSCRGAASVDWAEARWEGEAFGPHPQRGTSARGQKQGVRRRRPGQEKRFVNHCGQETSQQKCIPCTRRANNNNSSSSSKNQNSNKGGSRGRDTPPAGLLPRPGSDIQSFPRPSPDSNGLDGKHLRPQYPQAYSKPAPRRTSSESKFILAMAAPRDLSPWRPGTGGGGITLGAATGCD